MALGAFPQGGSTTLLKTLLLFLHSLDLVSAITDGPMAIVSLHSEAAYQTARLCAAGCLVHSGVDTCSTGPAYVDVGVFLGCGKCYPVNTCYCAPSLGSSATSYISSCVSLGCGESVQNWLGEMTSMLSIYNGYCATANVVPTATATTPDDAPTVTTKPTPDDAPTVTTKPTPAPKITETLATNTMTPPYPGLMPTITTLYITSTTTVGPATRMLPSITVETTGTTTSSLGAAPGGSIVSTIGPGNEKGGLSQSDIVALAASLSIGVPSLIVAVATLWIQLKRRGQRARESRMIVAMKATA